MRAIVQRVSAATVRVDGREVGRCGYGLMLLVGIHKDDTEREAKKLAEKIATLRIFGDAEGKMNLALTDFPAKGAPTPMYEFGVLAVSNFTVYGDASKSRRPSFTDSAGFEQGRALFDLFVQELRALNIEAQTGMFGANMEVALLNDGPVTVVVDV
jgi:D-aminoacyl-tRNA deacylase